MSNNLNPNTITRQHVATLTDTELDDLAVTLRSIERTCFSTRNARLMRTVVTLMETVVYPEQDRRRAAIAR